MIIQEKKIMIIKDDYDYSCICDIDDYNYVYYIDNEL